LRSTNKKSSNDNKEQLDKLKKNDVFSKKKLTGIKSCQQARTRLTGKEKSFTSKKIRGDHTKKKEEVCRHRRHLQENNRGGRAKKWTSEKSGRQAKVVEGV
jgi:hypothetical protein